MADANMYVLNPFFQTRSFDDMVKPLTMYALAYKEQEAKIEDMTDKAAALEWIANRDPQSQTAALYRDMSEKIKGIRDDMMINGLQGGTRSRILGARRMYSANSAEITRRYEDMKKYQERMEQMYDKDNSMFFSPESLNVSLDDFAGGKRPKIKAISGNEVMARGAAVGKRFTSQLFGDGVEGTIAGNQFWKFYQENGMSDEALAAALDSIGKGDKYPMLKKIIDGVYSSFEGFSPEDQLELRSKFMEGFYSGAVYNRQVSYQPNGEYINAAQREQLELSRQESARQNLALQLQGLTAGYNIDTKTGTISKNLKEPDRRVIKHDDGSATIVDIPYNEDGTQDTEHIRTINVDKDGNITSTGSTPTPSPLPSPSLQSLSQLTTAYTDNDISRAKQEDPNSYVTWTYKGLPKIKPVSGSDNQEGKPVGHYMSLYLGKNGFTRDTQSPILDWGTDIDGKLDNTNYQDKRWRKWIKTDEQYMPADVKSQYYKAKNEFLRNTKGKGNMKNYEIYYVLDITKPNSPIEFRFQSIAGEHDFKQATDEEVRGIQLAKVAIELCNNAGYDANNAKTKMCIETAYKLGTEGKYIRKIDFSGNKPNVYWTDGKNNVQSSSTQVSKSNNTAKATSTNNTQVKKTEKPVQQSNLSKKQQQKEDSLSKVISQGGLSL